VEDRLIEIEDTPGHEELCSRQAERLLVSTPFSNSHHHTIRSRPNEESPFSFLKKL
jgi:hypothetical protein